MVKNDEKSEFDLEKMPKIDQTMSKIQTRCHYSTLRNVLFDPIFSLQNSKILCRLFFDMGNRLAIVFKPFFHTRTFYFE